MLWTVICAAQGYDNGVGRLPNMGWNPWDSFGCRVSEGLVKEAAQKLVDLGLASLGYRVVSVDDCWAVGREGGVVQPDKSAFPSGMKSLGDWLHAKGLAFGIYSSSGTSTCAGRPGSLNFEAQDAKSYAEWGVDFLKYDDCGGDGGYSYPERYGRMSAALNKTGRPIFYSITSGRGNLVRLVGSRAVKKLANSFTNFESGDFYDNWNSFVKHLDEQVGAHNIPGPYGWANPDMLQVGNPGMNLVEQLTHFVMWAMLKAPLVIGCDIAHITNDTLAILGNKEVIAINQDPNSRTAELVSRVKNSTHEHDVWAARLSNNDWAVALVNRANTTSKIPFTTQMISLRNAEGFMRDLITHTELGPLKREAYMPDVSPHGVHLVKIYGIFGDEK